MKDFFGKLHFYAKEIYLIPKIAHHTRFKL